MTLVNGRAPGYLPTAATYGRGIYEEQLAVVAPEPRTPGRRDRRADRRVGADDYRLRVTKRSNRFASNHVVWPQHPWVRSEQSSVPSPLDPLQVNVR